MVVVGFWLWVISGCADLRMWQRVKGGQNLRMLSADVVQLGIPAKLDVYLPTNLVVITPISNYLKCLSSKVSFEHWKQLTFCNSKTDF